MDIVWNHTLLFAVCHAISDTLKYFAVLRGKALNYKMVATDDF